MATRITVHASPLLLKRGVRGVAGQPIEIVLHLPTAPALSAQGFEFDSAFPGPRLLACIPKLARDAAARLEARLLLFGHADEAGSDEHNKTLSERRAKVVFALLTQDLDQLDRIAHADDWKLIQYQAMMKTRGIEPLEVDGQPGPKTASAVNAFQLAYNAGVYHEQALRERAYGELKVDGKLGRSTEAALRDAYLALVQVRLDPARFFGPKTAGCGEFNRLGSPEQDRRVVLALYGLDFPTESRIPCREGDAGSCTLNRSAPHPFKCNFYRRTLQAEIPARAEQQSGSAAQAQGHVCLHLYSPKGKPVYGPRVRLTGLAAGEAGGRLVLSAGPPLEWSTLPLDEYALELTLGEATLSLPVPWLQLNDPVHTQCVRELSKLLVAAGDVYAAQVRLLGLHYDCGSATGELDVATREALQRFQQDHGLPANGELSQATSKALKDHFGA